MASIGRALAKAKCQSAQKAQVVADEPVIANEASVIASDPPHTQQSFEEQFKTRVIERCGIFLLQVKFGV